MEKVDHADYTKSAIFLMYWQLLTIASDNNEASKVKLDGLDIIE